NLSGLTLSFVGAENRFPGEQVSFSFRLERPAGGVSESIEMGWPGQDIGLTRVATIGAEGVAVTVCFRASGRGWLRPGRLLVQTVFPLGLVRAWTWLDLDAHALVYPAPCSGPETMPADGGDQDGARVVTAKSEDYQGLRQFAPGDTLRQ